MTNHEALLTRDDVSRKGGKELAIVENCVDTSIQRIEDYAKKKD